MEKKRKQLKNSIFLFFLLITAIFICMITCAMIFTLASAYKIQSVLPLNEADALSLSITKNIGVMWGGLFLGVFLMVLFALIFFRWIGKYFESLDQDLALSEGQNWVLMENTNDVVFQYDALHDVFRPNQRYITVFRRYDDSSFNDILKHIYPDDKKRLEEKRDDIFDSQSRHISEIRFEIGENTQEYIWCRLYASAIRNRKGKIVRVVGKLVNIHPEKSSAEKLGLMLRRDESASFHGQKTIEFLMKNYGKNDTRNKNKGSS